VATCPAGHASASDDFCDVCGVLISAAPSLAVSAESAAEASGPAGAAGSGTESAVPGEPCPRCGVARSGQFCESCGYDFTAPAPPQAPAAAAAPVPSAPVPSATVPPPAAPVPPPAAPMPPSAAPGGPATPPAPATVWPGTPAAGQPQWAALVIADRDYYDAVQAEGGPDASGISFPVYCPERRFPLGGTEVRIGRRSVSSGISPEIDLSVPPADPGVSRLHAVLLRAPDGTWSVVDPGSANGTVVNGTEIPQGQAVELHDGDRIHLGAWTELRMVRET
jgi:hypothetical protein